MLVELLIRCTTYILKLAGWLDVGIGRTVKGWGCDPDIYSSLGVGLRACRIACVLHYVYPKAGWVVGCGYWACCKGVGM